MRHFMVLTVGVQCGSIGFLGTYLHVKKGSFGACNLYGCVSLAWAGLELMIHYH